MRKRKPASWLAVTARAISARPSASIGVCERCSARTGAAVRRVVMAVAPRAVWPIAVWCSHSSDSAPLSYAHRVRVSRLQQGKGVAGGCLTSGRSMKRAPAACASATRN